MKVLPLELSMVNSRRDCNTTYKLGEIEFDIPLILSPMSFYTHDCIKRINNRFLYVLPRISPWKKPFYNYENISERIRISKEFSSNYSFAVSVGLDDKIKDIKELIKYTNIVCIDVASGYHVNVLDFITQIRDLSKDLIIISGNVGNSVGIENNLARGSNLVRFGIGTGNNCTTSINTCVGTNGLDCLIKSNFKYKDNIIYDGGIKNGNDFSFALLYSNSIMCSSIFGGTELNVHYNEQYCDNGYNEFNFLNDSGLNSTVLNYGMASKYAKPNNLFIEGTYKFLNKNNFEDVYTGLKHSLQSSMSYLNSHNLVEYKNSKFEIL